MNFSKLEKILISLLYFATIFFFVVVALEVRGATINAKVRSEDIVKNMIENKCDMESMVACFRNVNSWYVIQHCNSYDWQCHSRIQRESLNTLFCDGICTAVLLIDKQNREEEK